MKYLTLNAESSFSLYLASATSFCDKIKKISSSLRLSLKNYKYPGIFCWKSTLKSDNREKQRTRHFVLYITNDFDAAYRTEMNFSFYCRSRSSFYL